MSSEIIIDSTDTKTRVALLEDGELVEAYIEDDNTIALVGNIYRGRVTRVLPGMQAAFIDIGLEKNAFLYEKDTIDVLKHGQDITVQVVKEPFGDKGPRVSMNITLAGKYLIFEPFTKNMGVSRRIESDSERARLKSIVDKLKPTGMGVIIRTAAYGINEEDIAADIEFLTKLWDSREKKQAYTVAPKILHEELGLLYRTVRDLFSPATERLIINNEHQYLIVMELLDLISPSLKPKVFKYSKEYNIFEFYNIQSKLTKAVDRKVWLKSGGYIVIDHTEALTVVDVNTGKFVGSKNLEDTVMKTNILAAHEIAKQLRLRDIGGIIIIDFIDMLEEAHQKAVINALKAALKADRTRSTVMGITSLGLVEMTRKKVRHTLASAIN